MAPLGMWIMAKIIVTTDKGHNVLTVEDVDIGDVDMGIQLNYVFDDIEEAIVKARQLDKEGM